jgi:peptidoglycan/xylan/chitin deacetylase (PgdA/CDA1 family)
VRQLVARGHELGCHGDTHRDFDALDPSAAAAEIADASATLRRFAAVTSFRAPYLRFPDGYLPILREWGYRLDSSQTRYKRPLGRRATESGLKRVPASTTSSVLRLPAPLREAILGRLADPVVLFVHPWEFVDLRRERLRLDCRFRTGEPALASLRATIGYFRRRGARFVPMRELA